MGRGRGRRVSATAVERAKTGLGGRRSRDFRWKTACVPPPATEKTGYFEFQGGTSLELPPRSCLAESDVVVEVAAIEPGR